MIFYKERLAELIKARDLRLQDVAYRPLLMPKLFPQHSGLLLPQEGPPADLQTIRSCWRMFFAVHSAVSL